MATSLDKSHQMDFLGLALLAKDIDLTGDLSVADDVTIVGDLAVTGTVTNSAAVMTPSAGITSDAEDYASSITKSGDLITTRIYVDLTGLVGSTTDLDIIGKSAVASDFGQITTARNGLIRAGTIACLEIPTGGADDVDFYSATVGGIAENVIITDATVGTETALVTAGGAWTLALTKSLTGYPSANDYLYVINGEASVPGTFTAGKFLITLYGMAA